MGQFVSGPLPNAPSPQPSKVAASEATNPDTTYSWVVDYTEDTGILELPIAGPDGTPAMIVKTSAIYGYKLITWLAERIGAPPVLPSTAPADPANEKYAGMTLTNGILAVTPDGTRAIYRRGGTYKYALLNPVNFATKGLAGAKPPWAPNIGQNVIKSGDFQNLY